MIYNIVIFLNLSYSICHNLVYILAFIHDEAIMPSRQMTKNALFFNYWKIYLTAFYHQYRLFLYGSSRASRLQLIYCIKSRPYTYTFIYLRCIKAALLQKGVVIENSAASLHIQEIDVWCHL